MLHSERVNFLAPKVVVLVGSELSLLDISPIKGSETQ